MIWSRLIPVICIAIGMMWRGSEGIGSISISYNVQDYADHAQDQVCGEVHSCDRSLDLKAGEYVSIELDLQTSNSSIGDCSFYWTYDSDEQKPPTSWKWFKLASLTNCHQKSSVNLYIPSGLYQCDHCILRWEYTDLSFWPIVSFSTKCFAASLESTTPKENVQILPMFTTPGHTPISGQFYRKPYSGRLFIPGYPPARIILSSPLSDPESEPILPDKCTQTGITCVSSSRCSTSFLYCPQTNDFPIGPYKLGSGVICLNNQIQLVSSQMCVRIPPP